MIQRVEHITSFSSVQVVFGNDTIEGVAVFFWARMDYVMLGAGRHFEVFGMVALQAFDQLYGISPVKNGSSPQRGSRKMMTFGNQKVSP